MPAAAQAKTISRRLPKMPHSSVVVASGFFDHANEWDRYLLTDGREMARADLVIVAIIVLALLGKLSDSVLQLAERRLLVWRDVYDSNRP